MLSFPTEKDLNNFESQLPKDALRQIWLKLAQWFWRRRKKCEKFTDRRTDRRTDGRRANRKAHLSFQLSLANIEPTKHIIVKTESAKYPPLYSSSLVSTASLQVCNMIE